MVASARCVECGGARHFGRDHDDGIFAEGTTLGPGDFLVLTKGVDHTFGLGDADAVKLRDPNGLLVDILAWGAGDADVSFCRRPDGEGEGEPCDPATFGAPNG